MVMIRSLDKDWGYTFQIVTVGNAHTNPYSDEERYEYCTDNEERHYNLIFLPRNCVSNAAKWLVACV